MMQRPDMGTKVRVTATIRRRSERLDTWRASRRYWERFELGVARDGIYIGYRNKVDGTVHYIGPEEGMEFHPVQYHEAWLVVCNARENPILVFPDDVEILDVE
jgi:hypothetical protein